jgi:hypothetical protein
MQVEKKQTLHRSARLQVEKQTGTPSAPKPVENKLAVPDALLTDWDVERLTGRARKTLQKDRLRGGEGCIPFIRLGRLVRYRQSDVADFIAKCPTLRSTSDAGAAND